MVEDLESRILEKFCRSYYILHTVSPVYKSVDAVIRVLHTQPGRGTTFQIMFPVD